jgi:WD40 repeat protein
MTRLRSVLALSLIFGSAPLPAQGPKGTPAEDPLPPGALLRLGSTRWRCPGDVRFGTFSPNGKLLAVADVEGAAHLFNVATGRELHSFELKQLDWPKQLACLAFSPDGKYLALPGKGGRGVALYEVGTGKQVRTFRAGDLHKKNALRDYPTAVAFSPDGKTLVAGTRGSHNAGGGGRRQMPRPGWYIRSAVLVWGVATGKELWHVELGPTGVDQVEFSADGRYLAVAARSQALLVLDAATRKELHRHQPVLLPFRFDPRGAALWYRPDTAEHTTYRKIDLRTGQLRSLRKVPVGSVVMGSRWRALFLPDGGAAHEIWDFSTGRYLSTLKGPRGPAVNAEVTPEVSPVALSPDGRTLAMAVGGGNHRQTVCLFETATGGERHLFPAHREGVLRLAVSRDGRRIASTGPDERVCLWDRHSGKLLRRWEHPERAVDVDFSPDGKWVAAASRARVVLWDTATGKEVKRWKAPGAEIELDPLSRGLFTPDGKRFVTGGGSAPVEVRDVATGKRRSLFRPNLGKEIRDMVLSPDGRRAALAGELGVELWDLETGKRLQRIIPSSAGVQRLAFSADGKTLALGCDSMLVEFFRVSGDKVSRAAVRSIKVGVVNALALSPDGRTVATSIGWFDTQLRDVPRDLVQLWDVATGKERRRFAGHRDEVRALAFTPDGRALVSGSLDNTLLVWPVDQKQGPPQKLP